MATLAELLAEQDDSGIQYITLDVKTRKMTIPEEYSMLGIESDQNVKRLYFKFPKNVENGIDLSTLNLYVNYRNAKNDLDAYLIDDVKVEDDYILFSWLLSRHVTAGYGNVTYIICAKKAKNNGELTNEWNTQVAQGNVGQGLEATPAIVDKNSDVIEQILANIGNTQDVKSKFPNPYALTFTGAVEAEYDGSSAVTVTIPEASGETGGEVIDVDAEIKDYMKTVKPAIKSAIINKGGTVEDSDSFGDYAARIAALPNGVYPAETIPAQTTLVAQGLQDTVGIKLLWTDVGADGYLIIRKENAIPESSADGTVVYNSNYAEDGFTDTNVSKDKKYYYRIFCRNVKNQYQSTEAGAIAFVDYVDRSGQTSMADLKVGDTIKFGKYGTTLYTWKIVDTADKSKGFVTVAADQNPGNLMFDAAENDATTPNPVTNRKNQGNNRWLFSNARQFLNSDEAKNEWFTKQHDYDVRPAYYNTDAFLKDFTDYEKNIIVSKTNVCVRDTNDLGGTETCSDKIWLPSSFAMGLEITKEDDHVYEAFSDNAARSYQSNYWLRTVNNATSTPNTASGVRCVLSSGSLNSINASYFNYALRPFCLLPTSAFLLWSESDSAYYFADDTTRNSKEN